MLHHPGHGREQVRVFLGSKTPSESRAGLREGDRDAIPPLFQVDDHRAFLQAIRILFRARDRELGRAQKAGSPAGPPRLDSRHLEPDRFEAEQADNPVQGPGEADGSLPPAHRLSERNRPDALAIDSESPSRGS